MSGNSSAGVNQPFVGRRRVASRGADGLGRSEPARFVSVIVLPCMVRVVVDCDVLTSQVVLYTVQEARIVSGKI